MTIIVASLVAFNFQLCNEYEGGQQLVLPNFSDCSVVTKEDREDLVACNYVMSMRVHQRLFSFYEGRLRQ